MRGLLSPLVKLVAFALVTVLASYVLLATISNRGSGDQTGYRAQFTDKPANVIDKIVDGKLESFFKEICLLEQTYVKNQDLNVGDYIKEHVGKLGENIEVRRFARFAVGE